MDAKKDKTLIIGVIGLIVVLVLGFFLIKACANKEYTVTFNSNGGSAVSSQKVQKGDKVVKPSDPTRDGYTFAGWYLDVNDSAPYDFNKEVTEDITLTAKWTKNAESDTCTLTCGEGEVLDEENCTCVKDDEESTSGETIAVTGISVSKNSLAMVVGEKTKVTAKITPNNATNKRVTWKSSNTKVVTVDQNGNITAVGTGTATITVTAGGKTTTITVTVKSVPVKGITITGSQTVNVKNSITLTATVTPNNATNKGVTWESKNTSIATVNQSGVVTGVKEGTVTIVARSKENNEIYAEYTITVNSVYSIVLTQIDMGAGMVSQYSFVVYQDGVVTTAYDKFTINGTMYKQASGTVKSADASAKTATITLTNGQTRQATVRIKK